MTHHFRTTALFTVAAITSLVACGCGSTAAPARATSTSATGTSSAGSAGTAGSATATTRAPATPATTQAPTAPGTPTQTTGLPAGYLPLFPFASLADVRAWQASYQSRGHQPWHRGHDLTATAFAAFLGYTDVTQVAQSTVSGGDAHVEVGIKLLDGTIITAAIIHLVLFGSGTYAPWEVVGTDDHTFTVDRPGPRAPGPRADGEGPDPQAIARRRVVSRHTARGHVKNILMQLGTRSQLEAVVIAARAGFTARPTAGPEVT